MIQASNQFPRSLAAIRATWWSGAELKAYSEMKLESDKPFLFGNRPDKAGLFSPLLGPYEKNQACKTCKGVPCGCIGHFGHVDLCDTLVIQPCIMSYLLRILECKCFYCHKLLLSLPSGMDLDKQNDLDQFKMNTTKRRAVAKSRKIFEQGAEANQDRHDRFRLICSLSKTLTTCLACNASQPIYRLYENRIEYAPNGTKKLERRPRGRQSNQPATQSPWKWFHPHDLLRHLNSISKEDYLRLGIDASLSPPVATLLNAVALPPPAIFPPGRRSTVMQLDPVPERLSSMWKLAYKASNVRQLLAEEPLDTATRDTLTKQEQHLQSILEECITGTKSKTKKRLYGSGRRSWGQSPPIVSIRKRFDGKFGKVRRNNLGKSVEEAARDVITGDPEIPNGYIGVPYKLAMRLSFTERVTRRTRRRLQKTVNIGPDNIGGARRIKRLDGNWKRLGPPPKIVGKNSVSDEAKKAALEARSGIINLQQAVPGAQYGPAIDKELQNQIDELRKLGEQARVGSREDEEDDKPVEEAEEELFVPHDGHRLQLGEYVERYLMDHDVVLLTRPPALKRESIQARLVKIIFHSATLQPNVVEADQYHFDYDGDEMQLFVPQTEAAAIEAMELMSAEQSVLCEQDNSNHVHLHQGGIFGMYELSDPNFRLTRAQMMQLLSSVVREELDDPMSWDLPPPTHGDLYAGTDLIELLLPRIPLYQHRNVVIRNQKWDNPKGRMDKSITGESARSLIAYLAHYFPPHHHMRIVRQLQKLGCLVLQHQGISIGIGDLEDFVGRSQMQQAKKELLRKIQESDEIFPLAAIRKEMDKIWESRMNYAGSKHEPHVMERLINSGAKGSPAATRQMVFNIGLQKTPWIWGRKTHQHSTLPLFGPDETRPEARNYVFSSLLEGLNEAEFFDYAKRVRQDTGLQSNSVPKSGYAMRLNSLIVEDSCTQYDGTVRNSREEILQYSFGGDGINPARAHPIPTERFLPPSSMDDEWSHVRGMNVTLPVDTLEILRNDRVLLEKEMGSSSQDLYSTEECLAIAQRLAMILAVPAGSLSDSDKRDWILDLKKPLDPILGTWNKDWSDPVIGSNPLLAMDMVASFRQQAANEGLHKVLVKVVVTHILQKYRQAHWDPGTDVGPIAASDLISLFTQMGMDVKHSAGQSGSRSTNGLLYATQLLRVAPKMQTPRIKVSLLPDLSVDEAVSIILYWKRIRLIDWQPHYNVGDISDRYLQAKDVFWRIYQDDIFSASACDNKVAMSNIVIRIEIDLNDHVDSLAGVTVEDMHEYLEMQLEWLMREPQLHTLFSDMEGQEEQVSLVLEDSTIVPVERRIGFPYVAYVRVVLPQPNYRESPMVQQRIRSFFRQIRSTFLNRTLSGLPDLEQIVVTSPTQLAPDSKTPQPVCLELYGPSGQVFAHMQDLINTPKVDPTTVKSNNVHEVNAVLGIEAAREMLFVELLELLTSKGKYCDLRLLDFTVDYMTRTGTPDPFTRFSAEAKYDGFLKQISLEESLKQLANACMTASVDYGLDPVASHTMGRRPRVGTGALEILMDRDKLQHAKPQPGFFPAQTNKPKPKPKSSQEQVIRLEPQQAQIMNSFQLAWNRRA